MSEQPKDIGVFLKAERERQGLSLDMIHEATKIPIDSLKAIEEGYKVRTLSPFYFKSFVRLYAQYLNLDPNVLLAGTPLESLKKSYPPPSNLPIANRIQETFSLNLFARSFDPYLGKKILKFT
ncbi:MAG: helix-turn-helix domain-containing protein, partial [Candidatus Omnitrophica bacterium]|nr:helix-turn-helix domain-containing protein [Candidatus Omnitrophota bacterium]